MSQILIVEDEVHLARGLCFNFEAEGHQVAMVENGEDAVNLLMKQPDRFDVVVLDIMLPGNDGFWVVSEFRRQKIFVPVLILTARGRPEDVLKGFESGADDFLPKPFELSILLARLRSLLRRTEWMKAAASREPSVSEGAKPDVITIAGKTVDFTRLELHAHGEVIRLTLMEAELLAFLVRNAGRPVSRKQILDQVWGLREDTDTRAIDNFIVRLRRYLEEDPSTPRHLLTVRGVGYRFVADEK
jgi:two-component system, OmpR family, alkaline phosphatase synthesis response regulator PhoP